MQVPPQDSLEVANGGSVVILHSIWYNESEADWFLYAGFNRRFFSVSGVFDGVEVEYQESCEGMGCSRDQPGVSLLPTVSAGGGTRCDMVRVTVRAGEDIGVDGGNVTFNLFRKDSLLPEVIAKVTIRSMCACRDLWECS